jgi:hypothetical protein
VIETIELQILNFERNFSGNVLIRFLFLFQVQKYRIDEVYDSKVKAKNWDQLIEEFHAMTENRVTISKAQIIRFVQYISNNDDKFCKSVMIKIMVINPDSYVNFFFDI